MQGQDVQRFQRMQAAGATEAELASAIEARCYELRACGEYTPGTFARLFEKAREGMSGRAHAGSLRPIPDTKF